MRRNGFSQDQIDQWKDQPVGLPGAKKSSIILIHGWSAIPRQLMPLAEVLNEMGYFVSIPLLSGHGTVPEDLEKVKWEQWVEDIKKEVKKERQAHPSHRIVLAGASMGGNIALLVSLSELVDGIVLIGTPVHLRTHFAIWLSTTLLAPFNLYIRKRYPKRVAQQKARLKSTSYQYFPVKSVKETLDLIRESIRCLPQVTVPTLILQTNNDYLVAKYSPHVIFNSIGSKQKKIQWIDCEIGSHIMISKDKEGFISSIEQFINDLNS